MFGYARGQDWWVHPMSADCVFCPANWPNLDIVVHGIGMGGDHSVVIIRPLNPVTEGHVLVIADKHTDSAAQDPTIAASLMKVAAWHVGAGQANIITSIGPYATQTVMHTHVHVVPRTENDGLALPWTGQHERRQAAAPQQPYTVSYYYPPSWTDGVAADDED